MHRRFGLWVLTGPRSFEDPRIWREDSQSYQVQTPFQRAVGVRYLGKGSPRYPDAFTGFGGFAARSRPRSVAMLLKGWFQPGPVPHRWLSLLPGRAANVARATGYVLVATPRLRPVSKYGAVFVGFVRARVQGET
jgi:hypothetical protein